MASSDSDLDTRSLSGGVRDTFVVRIWATDGANQVHGHIQHVRSHKRACFATRERLMRFIQDQLHDPDGIHAEADC